MPRASVCGAGDSAAYQRTSVYGDDVVIVAAYRTPICKSKRGGFKDTYPDDLLTPVLKAVADVAAAIKAGFYDIGIGAGLESMTTNPMAWEGSVNPRVKTMAQAQDCLLPMGITSENVAHRFGVTRQEQDQAAVESHRKAAAATATGKFKEEIIPVATKIVDPKTGDEKPVTISIDDGIRPNASLSDLAKLKPVFKKDGTTTAGNSSQVSDGAGAVLLMRRSVAMQKGLPILGQASRSCCSCFMEVITNAFASQFVYCRKQLDLDPEKINVNGGAMAFGHPLGATGARCVATLLHEMKRQGKDCRFGIVSMCIGTGMGAAAVFERGDCVDELSSARKIETNNLLSKDAK
ncbi:unnamed protein product [Thlaspi arvense]|uniref:acetyl-CoA C-acyltransferase n=1 Tax=Thlaspi arvense TaxID=13288 RepID=A0AAU9TC32_THLAR|nr:unnamed protein product [Thlaspi arvense]